MVKSVAEAYEVEVLDLEEAGVESMAKKQEQEEGSEEDPSLLVARPPVVTVMGHVDHGKVTHWRMETLDSNGCIEISKGRERLDTSNLAELSNY